MSEATQKSDKPKGDTDTTSVSKGRFTVAISADLAEKIDVVGKRLSDAVKSQTGVGVELSRAQVVQSLVQTAIAAQDEANAAAQAGNGNATATPDAAETTQAGK